MATFTALPRRYKFLIDTPITRIAKLPPTCKASLDCAICIEQLTDERKPVVLHKTHVFCKNCIITWLREHNSCPSCRRAIYSHLSYHNQKLWPRIDAILSINVKGLTEGVILDESEIVTIFANFTEQLSRLEVLICESQVPLKRSDLKIEHEWIRTTGDALYEWREFMYLQAPQRVIWTTYDFPSALRRTVPSHDSMQVVSVSAGRSMGALHNTIDVECQRQPNSYSREWPTHIAIHPLFSRVRSVLKRAIAETHGSEGEARRYNPYLLEAVWAYVPILSQRAEEGHPDALAMQRCMTTLVTAVVEAEIRHARIMAQIEGPHGLVNRRYKGAPADDFESDVQPEEDNDEEIGNGDESNSDSGSDITDAAIEELAELAISAGDVTAMVAT
ncbi:hypothetical protein LTR95_006746 [Oleoguttula sp. CCFEE 5521]